jgi:putative flippase GtrA
MEGVLASAIRYIVAIGLVHAGPAPLSANLLAFIIAFQVSVFGHFNWSFKSSNPELEDSMRRFALVAIPGARHERVFSFCFAQMEHSFSPSVSGSSANHTHGMLLGIANAIYCSRIW